MEIITTSTDRFAEVAASTMATAIGDALFARGRALVGVSGGSTPGPVFALLAALDLDWPNITFLQIDERVAPDGDPARNLTMQLEELDAALTNGARLVALPVHEPQEARPLVEATLGQPPFIDVAQLGLGDDGHTASLVPGDPVLDLVDRPVGAVANYRGHSRLTLTYPVLNQARLRVWLVTGDGKLEMIQRLIVHDATIPAGRVTDDSSILITDAEGLFPLSSP